MQRRVPVRDVVDYTRRQVLVRDVVDYTRFRVVVRNAVYYTRHILLMSYYGLPSDVQLH